VKICDLTQFYSPVSGGVKRYVTEKVAYLQEHTESDAHILIIPGERDAVS
jgi:alpha-1,6-mannosyltransferase